MLGCRQTGTCDLFCQLGRIAGRENLEERALRVRNKSFSFSSLDGRAIGGTLLSLELSEIPDDEQFVRRLIDSAADEKRDFDFDWLRISKYAAPDDYVFATDAARAGSKRGKQPLWLAKVMQYHIQPAAQGVGIRKQIAWHTFRHTYTTLLHANGEDVKVVQELLQHGSAKITMDIYAQVTKAKRTAQTRVVACLRAPQCSLEDLCPQNVPAPELANGSKAMKRFGVPLVQILNHLDRLCQLKDFIKRFSCIDLRSAGVEV
jgi:hypothetical protein